ncbi:hypothetical protein, partial [Enterobacter cloacae complex sp. 4DZ1-17B1]|uniref:hypothetical protein n=1 Tax=Enterobacter cloacae complex sp. 4DZ1-17B1 TaxID=2511991 RepID=UPI001CA548A7
MLSKPLGKEFVDEDTAKEMDNVDYAANRKPRILALKASESKMSMGVVSQIATIDCCPDKCCQISNREELLNFFWGLQLCMTHLIRLVDLMVSEQGSTSLFPVGRLYVEKHGTRSMVYQELLFIGT